MFGIDDALLAAAIAGQWWSARSAAEGAADVNKMNAEQFAQYLAWQEHMANTSWQRGTADMRAAGINPMLAVSKGGAPVPSGGTPPSKISTIPNYGSALSGGSASGIETYLTTQKMMSDIAVNAASARKISIDADNASKYAPVHKALGDVSQAGIDWLKSAYVGIGQSAASGFSAAKSKADAMISKYSPQNIKFKQKPSQNYSDPFWFDK